MTVIAFFVLAFTLAQFLIALVNLIFNTKLPRSEIPGRQALVSVLIPARNEEGNIGNILEDLLAQDYGNIEILVFNDDSSDRTEDIAKGFMKIDRRVKVFSSDHLPEGWLGKNRACHLLSKEARGEYLLFIDADVRVSSDIIARALSFAERKNAGLISIFPRQIMLTAGEKLTVPLMNYILLTLLPLVLVMKSRFASLAAANGQFMFFNSGVYNLLEPHKFFKSNKVEDIETARHMKKMKFTVACMTGDSTIRCRMYTGLGEALNGFSKNVSNFFGNSVILAALFWLLTSFGFIFILAGLDQVWFMIWLSAYILTRIIVSFVSEQKTVDNLVYLAGQQVSLGVIVFYAIRNKMYSDYVWKGRTIRS